MKTFVLTVSRVFPATHKRKGEETYFVDKIDNAIGETESCDVVIHTENGKIDIWPKIHTIRSNYELWAKRIEQIQKGEAILSIRYWSGKPYNSKQIEICQLDKDSGIGIQKLCHDGIWSEDHTRNRAITYLELAQNDGLSLEDFKEWFKGYDLSKPMAILHFTSFRY